MSSLVSRHRQRIRGILAGLDRLRLVGSLSRLSHVEGLSSFLGATGVLPSGPARPLDAAGIGDLREDNTSIAADAFAAARPRSDRP